MRTCTNALTLLVLLALWPAIAGCGDDAGLPRSVRNVLENADTLVIYAVEPPINFAIKKGDKLPQATSEKLHEYPVYGTVTVSDKSLRATIIQQLYLGMARGNEMRDSAACFLPRHAIRATYRDARVDILLCFECAWSHVFVDGESIARHKTTSEVCDLLNQLLTDADVPLSPGSERKVFEQAK